MYCSGAVSASACTLSNPRHRMLGFMIPDLGSRFVAATTADQAINALVAAGPWAGVVCLIHGGCSCLQTGSQGGRAGPAIVPPWKPRRKPFQFLHASTD